MKKYASIDDIVNDEKYPFTKGQLRHHVAKRHENGLATSIRKIGRRIYIREDLLEEWIESFKDDAPFKYKFDTVEEALMSPGKMNMSLREEDFSVRAFNRLKEMNIRTIGDLCSHTETSLLANPRLGKRTLRELTEFLISFGIHLKEE